MRIAIGSDHAGFELKESLKVFLAEQVRQVLDIGTYGRDSVDYADYAAAVGVAASTRRPRHHPCGSGVGASMAPTASPIQAGSATTRIRRTGRGARRHERARLGGRVVGVELARELVGVFLNARFTGEHATCGASPR